MTMNKQFIVRADVPKDPALIIKNQLLLSPGKWKGQNITKESILNGMKNTNWDDGKSNSIIYGHRTNTISTYLGDPSPDMWIGYHSTPKYLDLSDGVSIEGMYADYNIWDMDLASKLAYGKVRAGVSEGMEYDYRTGQIDRFVNSSVINDPACKVAFLNLSDGEENKIMEIMEPRFLNLSEKDKKEDIYTDERGSNDENMNKDMEDKLKVFDEKISKVEGVLDEISKKLAEKKVDEKPKEDISKLKEIKEEPKKDEPKKDEPKQVSTEPVKKEPVVIDAQKKTEDTQKSDNSEVVKAINDMGDKMVQQVAKIANPQTVAPTNPNTVMSNMDDEKITEQLVEQYSKLHPDINSNE